MTSPDTLTGVLGLAGLFGAWARSGITHGFRTINGETVQDLIVGFALGVLWNVPIAGVWPIIDFREMGTSWLASATIVLLVSYSAADVISKRVIGFIRAKAAGAPDPTPTPAPVPTPEKTP